jgi:thimet oligopeptidase
MKRVLTLLVLTSLMSFQPPVKENPVPGEKNPIYNDFNEPIDFAAINADHIKSATLSIQEKVKAEIEKIVAVPDGKRTYENTLLALDDLRANLSDVNNKIYLLSSTHADSLIRNTALESRVALSKFGNEISLNEDLYKAVKGFSASEEARSLKGYQAKFLKETLDEYERNGFALSAEKRDQLKEINNEISTYSNQFSQNISTFKDELIVDESGIDGLPEDYKKMRLQEDGTYKIDMSYPSVGPFFRLSNSEQARKDLVMKFNNRAYPENIDVLQNLLKKRKEMAELLGHNTYSEYQLQSRMAKTPETVWEFENGLKTALKEKSQKDYNELLEIKRAQVPGAEKINGWERSYYADKLMKEKYQLDSDKVKEYFALDDVLAGLFTITQTLFDVEYREVENPSVWHEDVRMFEVIQDGKIKGRFYLDLFPRANKYGHAACFGILNGKMTPLGYKIPTASLVCNFPKPTEDKPSLMPHSQVRTFFHEFGHVLHQMMTTADLYSQSGTNVSRDFVEAPSQIFENWTWNYEALKMFARHYETGEVLPKDLFDKMLAAKNVGSGMSASGQVFLGTFDLTLHDKYDPDGEKTTTDVLKEVQKEISLIDYVEGTHFHTAFGHLTGYASSYYGYLWSKVYAQDMFSVFDENGIMDTETGIRYRDIILASGSSKDELELVKEFLGREPNNEAFLKELGL